MRRFAGAFGASLALTAGLLSGGTAWAQAAASGSADTGSSAAGSGSSAGAGASAGAASAPSVTTVTPPSTSFPVYPGAIAPTAPGKVLGGGNVQGSSSSRPITGNERDGFDLGQSSSSGGTVHGSEDSNIMFGGSGVRGEGVRGIGPTRVPNSHLVKKGDTLWDICDYYFRNPYEWPRIWALNPSLKNPHWIEPGENIVLRKGSGGAVIGGGPTMGLRGRTVGPKTLFLRDESFVEEGLDFDWGKIEGAREERMFLANDDEVYLRWSKDRDVKPGAEYSIFRDVKKTKLGTLVQLQGQVRIDTVDSKNKLARGRVYGSLIEIERGAHFGPVPSKYEIVSPTPNEVDKEGTLFAAMKPGQLYSQGQIVFVDMGESTGIKPGNTLEVIRRGDGLHRTMPARAAALRLETGGDRRVLERIPRPEEPSKLKDELVGTLRVLAVGKKTATCYALESTSELETGERVILRKGH